MSARVKGERQDWTSDIVWGRALFNPSSPAHACLGRHSGVKPPACQRSQRGG